LNDWGIGLTSGLVVLESYITHIRIIEDAAYPSSPPPPNANPDTKKPRLIIVAVRKSGRVRMHKARENANGTFSIGKTWTLDDLSAVQSYSGATPASVEEEQQKQWAAGVGFTVTIGKPYYWQANTQKEKQFFIASLVKIYTKYTGGKSPGLIGFDAREKDQLLGGSGSARPTPQSLQAGRPPASYVQAQTQPPRQPSREPVVRPQPSREAVQRPAPQTQVGGTQSFTSQTSRPQMKGQRGDSPSGSMDSNSSIPQQNQSSLRRLAGTNQSQESFVPSYDNTSLPPRSRGGLNGTPNAPGRFQERSVTPTSQRTFIPDNSLSSTKETDNDVPPVPAPLALPPERRRPPMPNIGDSRQRGQNSNDNIVPAPLSSPGMRREDLRLPTRSSERTQPRENTQPTTNGYGRPDTSITVADDVITERSSSTVEPTQSPIVSPSVNMPEEEEDEVRPGLGPMIKKKSKGDIAGTFLRAAKTANALNSFKPRAGGAAERLRETQAKSPDGPDGITGVVPAPSLLRGMSGDSSSLPTSASLSTPAKILPEKTSLHKVSDTIPEVKITVPPSNRPSSVEGPLPTPDNTLLEKSTTREAKRIKSPAETMAKELASVGIDPSILGDRGGELVAAWEEFGWTPGEGMRTKNIDQMKEEVERELNKIQAGGWLARIEEEDERIQAVQDGLQKVIDECDELDGLLTLYAVELSVSHLATILIYILTTSDLQRGYCVYRSPGARPSSQISQRKASLRRTESTPRHYLNIVCGFGEPSRSIFRVPTWS
jgi:hypothetical protein